MKKKKSFGMRLFLYNIIIISIVLAIILGTFGVYYVKIHRDNNTKEIQLSMDRSKTTINGILDELDSASLQISLNPSVISTLEEGVKEEDNYFETNVLESSRLCETLWSYIMNPDKISIVSVYTGHGDILCAAENEEYNQFTRLIDQTWIEYLDSQFRKPGVYNICVNRTEKHRQVSYQGISIIREIKDDVNKGECLGYVEVIIGVKQVETSLKTAVGQDKVILFDRDTDKVMATTINNVTANTSLTYDEFIQRYKLGNETQCIDVIGDRNIGIIVLQNDKEYYDTMKSAILLIMGIYLLCLIIIVLIQNITSQIIVQPLIQLCQSVEVSLNDKDEKRSYVDSNVSEIQELSDAFIQMRDRIDESARREVNANTQQIKTQLYALRAQMNPHFIHNTLAIIQSYAIEEDCDMVIGVCENLSDFIRYSSGLLSNQVDLMDEITNVRKYMNILHLKYSDNLEFEQVIQGDIREIKTPYFILQPLIENAITHGLSKKEFPWKITINCEGNQNYWKVTIKDNGVGMTKEQIQDIMKYKEYLFTSEEQVNLLKEKWEIGGLTIRNILMRLYLEYKENMIFEIESEVGEYTTITIGENQYDSSFSGGR